MEEYTDETFRKSPDEAIICCYLLELHPIFYGCFDWHSSVHGHWLLARALQLFPRTELAENITAGQ